MFGSGGTTHGRKIILTPLESPSPQRRELTRPSNTLGLFLFIEEFLMQIELLLREFAVLVGRALARQWLRQCDLAAPDQDNPDRAERKVPEKTKGVPSPEPPSD